MKQKLDERQMQEAAKIASISFYVMYGVCAAFLKAQSFPPCLQYSMYLLSEEAKISTAVLLFFTGITVLCFFTLRLMNFMTERKHRQQEQKYLDEE